MSLYYISHPFTGNPEKNRQEARFNTTILVKNFPEHEYLNPLDAALAYETAGASYEQILGYTLKLLSMCDGIIMTGKDESWRESRGCMTELHYAVANGFQEIYESPVDFMRKMRLRKEAMGAIHLGFSEEKGFFKYED